MSGGISRISYALGFLSGLEPAQRRERIRVWALKPGLFGRSLRFLLPNRYHALTTGRFARLAGRVAQPNFEPEYVQMTSARDATAQNHAEVARILAASGIAHSEIEDDRPHRRQIAIDVKDRSAFLDAFERWASRGTMLAAIPWTAPVRIQAHAAHGWRARLARRRTELAQGFVIYRLGRPDDDGRVFGMGYGTVVSLWDAYEDDNNLLVLRTAVRNRWSEAIPVPASAHAEAGTARVVGEALTGRRHIEAVEGPIDLVCLWVDGNDPDWLARRAARSGGTGATPDTSLESMQPHLYRSRDELRYALRSIEMWAPFVNHVYLVTDQQRPTWLDESSGGLTVVDHRDILPGECLPTFNSNAIDTALHDIPGLSERFLVTNDDMMFVGPVTGQDFFAPGGLPRLFLSRARIPLGVPLAGEAAVDSASRNNQRLLTDAHGLTPTQKFKHIMIPQRRSHRQQTLATFGAEVLATRGHPFRHPDDVSFSHLCLYDALARGEAVLSTLPYDYISLGDPDIARRLGNLRRSPGQLKVLCLNDSDVSVVTDVFGQPVAQIEVDPSERDRYMLQHLRAVYSTPSRWEKPHSGQSEQPHAPIAVEGSPEPGTASTPGRTARSVHPHPRSGTQPVEEVHP